MPATWPHDYGFGLKGMEYRCFTRDPDHPTDRHLRQLYEAELRRLGIIDEQGKLINNHVPILSASPRNIPGGAPVSGEDLSGTSGADAGYTQLGFTFD